MNGGLSILDKILSILASPQVQSALIAAVVSLLVAQLTTWRDRRARRALGAERLLQEVYNPIETSLQKESLYRYVLRNKSTLEKNRRSFSKAILPLIDDALRKHYYRPNEDISLSSDDYRAKVQEAEKTLQEIATRLSPLLTDEIKRLQAIVEKEAG